jgi:uncharacterized membrane protein
VLFGLAIAAKFYPLFLLAGLFPLCLRAGRQRAFLVTAAAAAVTWLAVNLPVALVAFSGWSEFYRLSSSRPADFGTVWDALWLAGWQPGVATANERSGALILLGFALIAVLVLAAPRRPRVPQVLFLVLAVFLLLNKVWSLQYVIWLVPLAVLARPRLWSFVLWQAAELGHFWVFWPYLVTLANPSLPGGTGDGPYLAAVLGRFLAVALLCALVVRDILRPETDLVRRDGADDPAGGVLDGAPDAVTLRLRPAAITLRAGATPAPHRRAG